MLLILFYLYFPLFLSLRHRPASHRRCMRKSSHKGKTYTSLGEEAEEQKVGIEYVTTIQRLLPGLLTRLAEVKDFRNPKKIKHKQAVILLVAIFWFVFQKASRRVFTILFVVSGISLYIIEKLSGQW